MRLRSELRARSPAAFLDISSTESHNFGLREQAPRGLLSGVYCTNTNLAFRKLVALVLTCKICETESLTPYLCGSVPMSARPPHFRFRVYSFKRARASLMLILFFLRKHLFRSELMASILPFDGAL